MKAAFQHPHSDVTRLERKLDSVAAILVASERVGSGRDRGSAALCDAISISQPDCITPEACIERCIASPVEAQVMLDIFCAEMAPHFPFVVVPPGTSFEDLKQKKPHLALNILMVGCRHDSARQIAIATKLRELISHALLIKGEQSLDLLQGFLVYLAWYHLHLRMGSQLTNHLFLLMALMTDLGLDKPENPHRLLRRGLGAWKYFELDHRVTNKRTLEEMRAFLGCFYITSIVSICARDIDPVRYSAYADECCNALEEAGEYPTDAYLVQLVHIHRLSSKIQRTLVHNDLTLSATTSVPIGAYIKSLEAELVQLKGRLLNSIPQATALLIHYLSIELLLYEIALDNNIGRAKYGDYPTGRLEILFACMSSATSFLDAFDALPLDSLFDMPYPVWTQIGRGIVIVSRLAAASEDGWDQSYVDCKLDFCSLVDLLGRKLETANELVSQLTGDTPFPRSIPSIFSTLAPRIQLMKEAHERRRAARVGEALDAPSSTADSFAPVSSDGDLNMMNSTGLFEFFDDSFWQQLT